MMLTYADSSVPRNKNGVQGRVGAFNFRENRAIPGDYGPLAGKRDSIASHVRTDSSTEDVAFEVPGVHFAPS